jgi:hypothetical protein
MHVICKCGHRTKINTGHDLHRKFGQIDYPTQGISSEEDKIVRKKRHKYEIFHKHINEDLQELYKTLSNKRNVIEQVDYQHCIKLLKKKDIKTKYEEVIKYLQAFLDLKEVPINITWEPLNNQNTLSDIRSETNILGTTYTIPMGTLIFYTIYLNQKFTNNEELMLATIAHELTHVYVSYNNIKLLSLDDDRGNKEYNEQMTDLLGVVLGMGKLMSTSSHEEESYNTGYLTNNMIRESYNMWNQFFYPVKIILLKLSFNVRTATKK